MFGGRTCFSTGGLCRNRLRVSRRASCGCFGWARILRPCLLCALGAGRPHRFRGKGITVEIDHQLRRIFCQQGGVLFDAVYIEGHAHDSRMVLRHAHRCQQIALDVDATSRDLRRQPRRVQIKKDPVRIRNPCGGELHGVVEIYRYARSVPVQ